MFLFMLIFIGAIVTQFGGTMGFGLYIVIVLSGSTYILLTKGNVEV